MEFGRYILRYFQIMTDRMNIHHRRFPSIATMAEIVKTSGDRNVATNKKSSKRSIFSPGRIFKLPAFLRPCGVGHRPHGRNTQVIIYII